MNEGVWGARPSGEALTAMDDTPAPDALRALVREVLRDVLPALAERTGSRSFAPATPPTSDPPPSRPARVQGVTQVAGVDWAPGVAGAAGARTAYQAASEPGVTLQPVRLATDEDLREFVLQVVRLAGNPKRRRDLLAGRLRFTLAMAGSGPAPAGVTSAGWSVNGGGSLALAGTGQADHRIERGAVTERAVQAAASAGTRLVLGPRAVLTPLARDRARALGVPIEKER